ncbi:MAG: NAD-dependent epimerase/dehydratase family protein [Candidatus Latescibacteria bacterium]|mgnify:CR=1 FL=1|nr:NAD-dependent epimerase/dehydratase family protein [Candidatus Latescibacterota bacterium]
MRLFIIGGTRFIGHFVTRQLIEQGHDVTVFHRGQTPCDLPDSVQHIHGHRDTLADFTTEIDAFKPDVVLDMISMFEKNADTVMSVFQNRTDRVVLVSSCDVYKAYGIFHGKEQGENPHHSPKMHPCVTFSIPIEPIRHAIKTIRKLGQITTTKSQLNTVC